MEIKNALKANQELINQKDNELKSLQEKLQKDEENYKNQIKEYIEWTDSAETVLINNNKQATAILKACNNKPSPEDKKKLDSIFAKGKKQIDYFKKCKDKIYPKTVKEWENRFIEETNPD